MRAMVFYKDLRRAVRYLLAFPGLLLAWYLANLLFLADMGVVFSRDEFIVTALTAAMIMSVLIAIVVGLGVICDERVSGTELFLARLPLSRRRLLLEKLGAGLLFILFLYGAILVYYNQYYPASMQAPPAGEPEGFGTLPLNLLITLVSAFLFAVVLSRFLQQPLAIFLAAIVLEFLLWTGLDIIITGAEIDWRLAGLLLVYAGLFFLLPGMLWWKQWQLPIPASLWGEVAGEPRFTALVWVQLARNGLVNLLPLLLVLAALSFQLLLGESAELVTRLQSWELNNSVPVTLLATLAILLPVAAGANAYTGADGNGLACLAHNHPVSRSRLYWSKMLAGVPTLLLCWLVLVLVLGDAFPVIGYGLYLLLAFTSALHMSLWLRSPMLVVLTALSWLLVVFFAIQAWMVPREAPWFFRGFAPVHDPRLVGLLPLTLLTLGGILTGWYMATSRRFLTGSTRYREYFNIAGTGSSLLITVAIVWLIRRLFIL